jgi:hypothetical protein
LFRFEKQRKRNGKENWPSSRDSHRSSGERVNIQQLLSVHSPMRCVTAFCYPATLFTNRKHIESRQNFVNLSEANKMWNVFRPTPTKAIENTNLIRIVTVAAHIHSTPLLTVQIKSHLLKKVNCSHLKW